MKICELKGCDNPIPEHWPNGKKKAPGEIGRQRFCSVAHGSSGNNGNRRGPKTKPEIKVKTVQDKWLYAPRILVGAKYDAEWMNEH